MTAPALLTFHGRLVLAGLLTLGVMARAATVRSPVFDFHSWRQADTATIARNFVREDFNPLHPQVDFRGDQPVGYVETGFELHAFLVAILARVAGFSTELGRLVSVLSFPVSVLLLFAFVRDRYGQAPAMVGAAIYAVGLPLTMYVDRALLNEPLLALLTFACLRSTQVYLERGRASVLLGLVAAVTLIAVVKPPYLIVGAAIAGLFAERDGVRALARWELWLVAAAASGAATAWFMHARGLYALTGLSFGIADKLFDGELLLSWRYVAKIGTRLLKDVLGPVGAVAMVYGLVVAWRRRRWAEPLGVAAFHAYLAVVTIGNFAHNYYQLPIVPVAAVLIGLGVTQAVQRRGDRRGWTSDQRVRALAVVVWLTAVTTFVRVVSAHSWYEVSPARVCICEELTQVLKPNQRVAFAHYGSPDILFCVDRRGWLLQDDEVHEARLAELLGRDVVIVTERRFDVTVGLLDRLGAVVAANPGFVAYGRRP